MVDTAAELETVRAHDPTKEPMPKGADPETWAKYGTYWTERAAQLRRYFAQKEAARTDPKANAPLGGAKRPDAMVTWETYAAGRKGFNEGKAFETKMTGILDADVGLQKKYDVQDQVGVASDVLQSKHESNEMKRTPQRPDHLALDRAQLEAHRAGGAKSPVEGVAYSDKSYDFSKYSDVQKVVEAHVEEALESYGGNVEIRSDKYGPAMRGQLVSIKEVMLVYDVTKVSPKMQAAIERYVDVAASGQSNPHHVKLTVIFK